MVIKLFELIESLLFGCRCDVMPTFDIQFTQSLLLPFSLSFLNFIFGYKLRHTHTHKRDLGFCKNFCLFERVEYVGCITSIGLC